MGILSARLHEHDYRSIDMHIEMNLAPESGRLLNLNNGNHMMGFRFITVDYTLLVLCIFNV